jgi:hypothetical protein
MTIIKSATRILVLFTVVSLEEGDGPHHAAVARDPLRCARPVDLVVDHNDIQAGPLEHSLISVSDPR